jgi:hypothetical protein
LKKNSRLESPRQNNTVMIPNMAICIHLSNHILSNRFSFGKADPGSVNNTKEIKTQLIAGRKKRFLVFKEKNLLQY